MIRGLYPSDPARTLRAVGMNQSQRRRAQRLRAKHEKHEAGDGPPLSGSEVTWLAWYEENKGPSPIRPTPEPEDEPEPEPEDEDEPEAKPARVIAPEPARPRYDVAGQAVERERSTSPDVVERLTVGDCSEESMRSAVNVQIAAGQMMERACVIALDLAEMMKQERGGIVGQLVDALTALVDAQAARGQERAQQVQAQQSDAAGVGVVTDEIGKRMIDGIFPPPAAVKQEPTA